MEERDLDHMLASSPVLEKLVLVDTEDGPKHVRLRGRKLQCVILWLYMAVELAATEAPRLERLIMWGTRGRGSRARLKIAQDAPALKVLGFLDAKVHELQIGDIVVKVDTNASPIFTVRELLIGQIVTKIKTKVSPRSVVPSVKILAVKLNFGVFKEVQMLVSFLRCFPNIETLHVECVNTGEKPGKTSGKFFEKLHPIECVQSNIKLVVLHVFHGDFSELIFLDYLLQRANALQKVIVVSSLPRDLLLTLGLGMIEDALKARAVTPWANEACMVLLMEPKDQRDLDFDQAFDLSVDDPFLQYGPEVFRLTKGGE
ncbi:hypothetical protein ACP4OV_011529 [Aristida adscensionis]